MSVKASRMVVLLPPSKGKTGDDTTSGPSYRSTLDGTHPLNPHRRTVLQAIYANHRTVELSAQRRLYGVGESKCADAALLTDGLLDAPTKPARERYHGVVYTNAGLQNPRDDHPDVDVLIVSALLGVADLDTPVPNYRIEFGAGISPIGALSRFWGVSAGPYLNQRLRGKTVINLLPNEHRGIIKHLEPSVEMLDVAFTTPAGSRANTARIKVAKGQLVAVLRKHGPLPLGDLAAMNPLAPTWTLSANRTTLTAVCQV